ncbi:MAG: hypothetical protein RL648_793 [Verrucomicrobiota bacterium]
MSGTKIQARHVFQGDCGNSEREGWAAATGEPCFVWGGWGQRPWRAMGAVQRSFREWVGAHGGDNALTLYHDGAGADVLGSWDPSPHKVLLLHRWPTRWEGFLAWQLRHTGRLAVAGGALSEWVRQRLAWIPARYIHEYPSPMVPLSATVAIQSEQRTAIWLQGQAWKPFGNRLRAVVDLFAGKGQPILIVGGEGRRPAWGTGPMVDWQAGVSVTEALHKARACDSILLLNDFSLQAPWLWRLVRDGVFVLVPDGGSPSRSGIWMEECAPTPYPWGDMEAALSLLYSWRTVPDEERRAYRDWGAQGLFTEGELFERQWDGFKVELWHQSAPHLGQSKARTAVLPVAWYERVDRLRRGE